MKKPMGNPKVAALDDLEKELVGASAKRHLSRKQTAMLHAKKPAAAGPGATPEADEEPDEDDFKKQR